MQKKNAFLAQPHQSACSQFLGKICMSSSLVSPPPQHHNMAWALLKEKKMKTHPAVQEKIQLHLSFGCGLVVVWISGVLFSFLVPSPLDFGGNPPKMGDVLTFLFLSHFPCVKKAFLYNFVHGQNCPFLDLFWTGFFSRIFQQKSKKQTTPKIKPPL